MEGKDVIMSFAIQKNRKVLIGFSAVLVILIGALLFYFLYWVKTPAYSLGLVKNRLKTTIYRPLSVMSI